MATKADIEAVRAEIAKLSATLTWRMILVAGIAQALGIGALLQFPALTQRIAPDISKTRQAPDSGFSTRTGILAVFSPIPQSETPQEAF